MDEKLERPNIGPKWILLTDGYNEEYRIDVGSLTGITFSRPYYDGGDWVIWLTDGRNEWVISYCDDRPIGHKEFQRDKAKIKKAWEEINGPI